MRDHLPIFVINLDRASGRLSFIDDRMRSLGLDYTRISAVDGGALSEVERTNFAALRPRDGRRGWRPGQIGCFLSHMDAWQRAAAGAAGWTLVLEDDLHVSDALPALLGEASWQPGGADLIRLESTGQWLKLGTVSQRVSGRTVRRVGSPAWGAGAYLVSKAAAARLTSTDPTLHSPVDDFLFNPETSKIARDLATYQVLPALAAQDKFNGDQDAKGFGSDIETDRINGRLNGLAKLRRTITSTIRGKTAVPFR